MSYLQYKEVDEFSICLEKDSIYKNVKIKEFGQIKQNETKSFKRKAYTKIQWQALVTAVNRCNLLKAFNIKSNKQEPDLLPKKKYKKPDVFDGGQK